MNTKYYDRTILGGLMLFSFVLPFVYHSETFVTLGLLVPLIAWIIKLIIQKGKEFNPTPLMIPLMVWGIIILVSVCWVSIDPSYSLRAFRTEYLMQIALFFIVTNNLKKDYQIRYLLYALLAASLIVSLYTIGAHFTGMGVEQGRATGTYGSFCRQAMYFIFLIPLTFHIFLSSEKKFTKYSSLLLFILSFFALLLTSTRGAVISSVLVVLILSFRKSKRLTLAVLLAGLVLIGVLPHTRQRMLKTVNLFSGCNLVFSGRAILWKNTLVVIKDHPWMGAGYGPNIFNTLGKYYNVTVQLDKKPPIRSKQQEPDAHNLYLQLLVEVGIIGLVAFLYLISSFYRIAFRDWKIMKENRELLLTLVLVISGLLLYGVVGYFYEDRNCLFFWLYLSLTVALAQNGKEMGKVI